MLSNRISPTTPPPRDLIHDRAGGGITQRAFAAHRLSWKAPAWTGRGQHLFAAALLILAVPRMARAKSEMRAELLGHAILPANTLLQPPGDAPRDALISGKFTGPGNLREDRPGSIMGRTSPEPQGRETGLALPFIGQAVQGFSSMKDARIAHGHRHTHRERTAKPRSDAHRPRHTASLHSGRTGLLISAPRPSSRPPCRPATSAATRSAPTRSIRCRAAEPDIRNPPTCSTISPTTR